METFGNYLLKSVVWLTGFAIVFLIVLRNERYFQLNRIYLLLGIISSIILPFFTWHYTILIPNEQSSAKPILDLSTQTITKPMTGTPIFWWFYSAGIGWLAIRLIWQTVNVIQKLHKAEYEFNGSVKLVRTDDYAASFSFLSYVFVNPSMSDIEAKEIVNHETEHIKQKHWFDLLFAEIFCILQWFNPFVWIYAHLIRQNHEYLADERALQNTSDPALYRAAFLNQLLGAPVIRLSNSFNYSLNRKRYKMMKKSMHSPFRKLKLLLILPLMALVFYAFAKPEFKTFTPTIILSEEANLGNDSIDTKGSVVKEAIVKMDSEPIKVKHLGVFETKKNVNKRYLAAVDTAQRMKDKSQEITSPIKIMTGDSVISKTQNNRIFIGHPPTNKLFGNINNLVLIDAMHDNLALKIKEVSQIKLDFPKKSFGVKIGHPFYIMSNDSTIKRP